MFERPIERLVWRLAGVLLSVLLGLGRPGRPLWVLAREVRESKRERKISCPQTTGFTPQEHRARPQRQAEPAFTQRGW